MFRGFFFHVWCRVHRSAISIGGYKEDDSVRCASPNFMLIAYYLGFTNRKRKYFEEKMTAALKSKQTSIATVRNHL
jgi:hypothetical protein